MNETIETILSHRSVRSFTDEELSSEEVEILIKAGQSASTSSYLQAYSIIGVTDRAKKEKLAEVAGNQEYVANSGHFFVFCADLHRLYLAAELEGRDVRETLETTEKFIVAIVDASLAAQNLSIAAESLGLGICYIGGLRNDLNIVSELLELPEHVVPLYGLTVGHPVRTPGQKPRLPLESVYYENSYERNEQAIKDRLAEYNETIGDYYRERTAGKRTAGWTKMNAEKLTKPVRTYIKDFLAEKGFPLK